MGWCWPFAQRECTNLEGSLRAGKRAQAVDDLLEEAGLAGADV